MAILLTEPLAVGDLDVGAYTHTKIQSLTWSDVEKQITLCVMHGTVVDSAFVRAKIVVAGHTSRNFTIADEPGATPPTTHYSDIVAKTSSTADEVYYNEVARELYQWLIDNDFYSGTIV